MNVASVRQRIDSWNFYIIGLNLYHRPIILLLYIKHMQCLYAAWIPLVQTRALLTNVFVSMHFTTLLLISFAFWWPFPLGVSCKMFEDENVERRLSCWCILLAILHPVRIRHRVLNWELTAPRRTSLNIFWECWALQAYDAMFRWHLAAFERKSKTAGNL